MTVSTSNRGSAGTPRDLELSVGYEDGATYSISWGSGSFRKCFDTDSPTLAAAIMALRPDATPDQAVGYFGANLRIAHDEAWSLVSFLSAYGLFDSPPHSPYYDEWLKLGWADALGIHTATANAKWIHDYRGAPKVMVRDYDNKPVLPQEARPLPYHPNTTAVIPLPDPPALDRPFHEVARSRRTSRSFQRTDISLSDVAAIARWTLGKAEGRPNFVTPTYIKEGPFVGWFIFDGAHESVAAAVPGEHRFRVCWYDPATHALGLVASTDGLNCFADLMWGQIYGDGAPVMFVLGVDWMQYMWKYRQLRAYRWPLIECGGFMQTAVTVATALGLRTFQTPAVDDARLCGLLGLDPAEVHPLYAATFGRRGD